MATRSRSAWKPRTDGQYDCRVGWKLNRCGKRDQHRFRLGCNLKEAQRRDHLLRQMWERIETIGGSDSVWKEETLEIAKLVAKGITHLHVPRHIDEGVVPYAQRVTRLRQTFPMLAILPEPDYSAAFGVQLLETLEKSFAEAELEAKTQHEKDAAVFRQRMSNAFQDANPDPGPTLHEAMRDYIEWLKREYIDPGSSVTPWGRTQIRQVESLLAHHADLPLTQVDHDEVECLFRYWRQRPLRQGSKQRVTKKSASHFISALRNFFKWLHARPDYPWRKPDNFEDLKTRILTLDGERRIQVQSEQLFSREELNLLFRYGDDLDRLLILLGLNCGFGAAESASLLVGEIFLRTPHAPRQQEMLDATTSAGDSFVKRIRRKSGVYGEFLLFSETVRAIEWAIRERRQYGDFGAGDRLLLNSNGQSYDKPTRAGNANRQIPNRFARLLKRIKTDGHVISDLPFKTLRKTGGDLVKRFSDGEIAGVFLCHGQPVATDELSDAYTQRPFGKVFEALRKVEDHLHPILHVR